MQDPHSEDRSTGRPPGRLDPVVVACAADRGYALPLAVMLRSALAHLSSARRLEVFVVDGGVEPDGKRRVEGSLTEGADVHWVPPRRAAFFGLPLWGRMPIATYDKLVVAELLPERVTRAIWLDCDLLVLRDLAPLWDAELGEHHLLAVQDALVPRVSSRFGVAGYEELGIPHDAEYFNAGVMVIHAGRWRRDDVAGRALAYLRRYGERVFFFDQEALNATLAGRWGKIDGRWNWAGGLGRRALDRDVLDGGAAEAPWILHFTGDLKPWRYRSSSAGQALYLRYLDMTAWAGWRPARSVWAWALGLYEASRVRQAIYPAERWRMQLVRRVTRTYADAVEGRLRRAEEERG